MDLITTAVGKECKSNLVIPAYAGIHNTVPYGTPHGFPLSRE
jgi:hypothetical protein